jgi:hypothetical protein
MNKFILFFIAFLSTLHFANAQYYAQTSGPWNDPNTWTIGLGGPTATVAPSSTDDVYTNGFQISISNSATCKDLHISHNVVNGLTINGSNKLTITGTLTSYNDILSAPTDPVSVIFSMSSASSIDFTADNVSTYSPNVIRNWSTSNAFDGRVRFNFTNVTFPFEVFGNVQFNTLTFLRRGNLISNSSFNSNGASQLSIGAFGTFTANGSLDSWAALSCEGDFINNVTSSITSVSFFGNRIRSISGSGILNATDISVTNTAGYSNNSTINLSGTISLGPNAIFDADGTSGSFNLISSGASNTAQIAEIPASAIWTGDISYQRFVPGSANWRYFAIPIINGNLGMWRDDIEITGDYSDASTGGNVTFSNAPSVYRYNATVPQWDTVKGFGANTSTVPLSNTSGYSVYVYGSNETWEVNGTPAQGPISIPLLGATWNLIPNPYPSSIDWDDVTSSGSATTVVLKYPGVSGLSGFATYNRVGGVAANSFSPFDEGIIASGQCFWVDGASGGSVDFTESSKSSSDGTFLRQAPKPKFDHFRITIEKGFLTPNYQRDETVILFSNAASDSLDLEWDSRKYLANGFVNLSSYMNDVNQHFAINSLSFLKSIDKRIVNLRLDNTNPGNYGLRFTDLDKMHLNYGITLFDNYTGKSLNIKANNDYYAFTVDQNPASYDENRFDIVISSAFKQRVASSNSRLIDIYPNPSSSQLNIVFLEQDIETVTKVILCDFQGNIYKSLEGAEIQKLTTFDIESLRNGIYVLKVISADSEQNYKIYKR